MRTRYHIHKNVKGEYELYKKDDYNLLDYLETFTTLEAALEAAF